MTKHVRFADRDILQRLNDEALRRDYNRSLNPAFIKSQPEDEIYAIAPIIIHEHAKGKAVEPHLRCSVSSATGRTKLGFLMLDVPYELFDLLPEREVVETND